MPNPGAFHGSRKAFLIGKKKEFVRAVTFGYTADLLGTIQRLYFKRYPIDLPHDEEPSAEHLAAVDDEAPDPEIEQPDELAMPSEEYQAAMKRIAERKKQVAKRRAQIKRWFIYQYMKDSEGDPRDQRVSSPYYLFLTKLRGGEPDRPRRKSPVNIWRKFHRERINKLANLTAQRENTPKSGMACLRDKIARDLFAELPFAEQKEWTQTSVEEHNLAIADWEEARSRGVSTAPADRQRAIQGLVQFLQPVLDVVADATGWKVSCFVGGPEPAQQGMLNVISVHSGTTTGDVRLSFGQSERAAIKTVFIPAFGSFLQKCYTPEECRARALSELEGFVPISDMELEGGDAIIHPLTPYPAPAATAGPSAPAAPAEPSAPSAPAAPAEPSAPSAPAAPAAPSPPAVQTSAANAMDEDDDMPALREPELDDDNDSMDEEEETPFPVSYAADLLASPVFLPATPVQSRQASLAPSPLSSPALGLATLPVSVPESLGQADDQMGEGSLTPAVPSPAAASNAPVGISCIPTVPAPALSSDPIVSPAPASTPAFISPASASNPAASSNPAVGTLVPARSSKAHSAKRGAKENDNPGPLETSDRRPRREVKKTEKALCIEEEKRKGGRGKKRSLAIVEDASPVGISSKRRAASKKKGSKV